MNRSDFSYDGCIEFLSSISGMRKNFFRKIAKKCLIAGGSIVWYIKGIESSDIDIFIPEHKDDSQVRSVLALFREYGKIASLGQSTCDTVLEIEMENCPIKFQIISHDENAQGILNNFDADYCRVGIHRRKLIIEDDAWEALNSMVSTSWYFNENRYLKALEKGFQVVHVPTEGFVRDAYDDYEEEEIPHGTTINNDGLIYKMRPIHSDPTITPMRGAYGSGIHAVNPACATYRLSMIGERVELHFIVRLDVLNKERFFRDSRPRIWDDIGESDRDGIPRKSARQLENFLDSEDSDEQNEQDPAHVGDDAEISSESYDYSASDSSHDDIYRDRCLTIYRTRQTCDKTHMKYDGEVIIPASLPLYLVLHKITKCKSKGEGKSNSTAEALELSKISHNYRYSVTYRLVDRVSPCLKYVVSNRKFGVSEVEKYYEICISVLTTGDLVGTIVRELPESVVPIPMMFDFAAVDWKGRITTMQKRYDMERKCISLMSGFIRNIELMSDEHCSSALKVLQMIAKEAGH